MISEHEFADSFDSFWESSFPLLSPSFIRDFNLRQSKRIPYRRASYVQSVPIASKEHADIVAEIAFEMFRKAYLRGRKEGHWRASDEDFEPATRSVMKRFLGLKNRGHLEWLLLSKTVLREANSLVNVYSSFFSTFRDSDHLIFRPKIRGAGILRTVEGDMCTLETLVEIKTVNRNLTSSDFRQLLVYLALGLSSGEFTWREAVFFNPRRAIFYTFNVQALVAYLSARNAPEVFDDFIYFLSERETNLVPSF